MFPLWPGQTLAEFQRTLSLLSLRTSTISDCWNNFSRNQKTFDSLGQGSLVVFDLQKRCQRNGPVRAAWARKLPDSMVRVTKATNLHGFLGSNPVVRFRRS